MENKLIEEILENFDFERVKKTMDLLNWTYCDSEEVPSTYRLIKAGQERLEEAYKKAMERKEDSNILSGGFEAYAGYNEEKKTVSYLDLKFVLTNWDAGI